MSDARYLLRSSIARTLFTVAQAVIAFFTMPYLVRTLGDRWYGIWVVISGLVANYYLLDLGLAQTVTRFISRGLARNDPDDTNTVINTSLLIYSILAAIIVLITLGIVWATPLFFHDAGSTGVVRLTILVVGLQFATDFPFKSLAGIISSHLRYDLLMYARLVNLAVSTALTLYFVANGYGILALAVVGLVCEPFSSAFFYLVAKRLFPQMKFGWRFVKPHMVKELFGYSSWAFVIQIANQARFKTDSVVIANIVSARAVTHYAVGLRLVEYLVDLVYRATNMMTPVFTRYYFLNQHDEIREKLLLLTRLNTVLALFGGGMLVIVGRAFIERWMGPDFSSAYPVLVILMVGMSTELIGCYADNLFYAFSKHKWLAIINVIEGIANVALSVLLIRIWGVAGVAAGTAIPLMVMRLTVIPVLVTRMVGIKLSAYFMNMVPTAAFTLLYLAVYWFLSKPYLTPTYPSVLAVGLLAVPLYVMVVPFVTFTRAERSFLLGLLPRPAWLT
jgi:O-antigen/teichoic acid export membrane protein